MLSVVIPVYKNKEQLFSNLEANSPYLKNEEVIIVNDFPEDNLENELKKYPFIKYIQNEKNLGFALTADKGVRSATNNYVMLLNSDVLLNSDSFKDAVEQFKKDFTLFGVSFAQKEKDGSVMGKNILYWKNGFLNHAQAKTIDAGLNGWAEGGSCVIDRQKYLEIGGFDGLYSPFYWEDTDLSYKAWKKGYKIIFDPAILVEHFHQSTIAKYFNKSRISQTAYRNQFIFIWKNINDKNLLLNHILRLPVAIIIDGFLKGDKELVKGWIDALKFLPTVIKKRNSVPHDKSDKEILKLFV